MFEAIELDWFACVHVSRYREADIAGNDDLYAVDHDLLVDPTLLVLCSQPNPDRGSMGNHVAIVRDLFDHH